MRRHFNWIALLGLALLPLTASLLAPAMADDDDAGNFSLGPDMQWRMAASSWDRREYDDAASLMTAYASANPDEPNAIDAWWRAYEIYRAYRPNADRKKSTFIKATEAAARWTRKYAGDNKERAAQGLYYNALLADREGLRPQATNYYIDMVKKFPGSSYDQHAYWALGEWLREAKRYKEAIEYYGGYYKTVGPTDWAAVSCYRQGLCYEEMKDKENAILAYKQVLNGPFSWRGWYIVSGALETAYRLRALKEDELTRAFALKIIDKAPQEWTDFQAQARALLGETQSKKITIYQYLNYNYQTDRVNIDGQTKLNLTRDLPLLVRLSYITKETPFKGKFSVTPKTAVTTKAENLTAADGEGGKTVFTGDIVAPDANGGIQGDWNYKFGDSPATQNAPDGLTVTRKWVKQGPGWGECTIRIQSTQRWYFRIYLPNDKTNPNNLNNQPNSVEDGGKTFFWHPNYDLTQGYTIKLPIEVGGNAEEFYPRIRLERYQYGRYADKSGTGKSADYDFADFKLKLESEATFPWTFTFPGYTVITMDEVAR